MTLVRAMSPTLQLALRADRRAVARALRRGHPWVWADSLVEVPDMRPGTVVDLVAPSGKFVARGLADPGSPIAVRVFTLDPGQAIDATLLASRVAGAAARRAGFIDPRLTDAYRLVHGEADGLPGIVVDRYADAAVVRFDGAAAGTLAEPIRTAILDLPGIARTFERRSRKAGRRCDRSADCDAVRPSAEGPSLPLRVRENGLVFEVDPVRGQKTGLYLDQRDSRALVRAHAGGRRLLNLFCYTGGFAVAAAAGGCLESLSVDIAAPVLAAARRNLQLNGLDERSHRLVAADVFALLRDGRPDLSTFDLVVVDPPSLAPNRSSLPRALVAYRRLNAAVLARARPGTLMLTCSCSSHVDRPTFLDIVRRAADEARVDILVREVRRAGPDHPVLGCFPEGDYLKAVLLEVIGRTAFGAGRGAPSGRRRRKPSSSRDRRRGAPARHGPGSAARPGQPTGRGTRRSGPGQRRSRRRRPGSRRRRRA